MMKPERRPNPWSDERIEQLLHDFFEREVPEELRRLPAAPTAVRSRPAVAPASPRGKAAVVAGVTATAGALLLAALLFGRPSHSPSAADTDSPAAATGESQSATQPGERSAPAVSDTPAPQFAPGEGPVELQEEHRTGNVSAVDPEGEERPELGLPELEIEIIPIEDKKKD